MSDGELLVALVGGVGVLDFLEGRGQFVAGDGQRFVVEVEAPVEGAVELASGVVGRIAIQRGRVADQIETGAQPIGSQGEFAADVDEAGLDAAAFELDGVAAFQDFGPGQESVGGQVDESLFAGVELGQLSSQLVVGVAGQLLLIVQGGGELVADSGGEVGGYLQAGVVRGNGVLDLPGGQVRQIAVAVLAGAAEEVAVILAGAAFGFGVDQP